MCVCVSVCLCVFVGVGHRGHRAEAEERADWSQPLGPSTGGFSEPPVQRLLSDHQGSQSIFGLFVCWWTPWVCSLIQICPLHSRCLSPPPFLSASFNFSLSPLKILLSFCVSHYITPYVSLSMALFLAMSHSVSVSLSFSLCHSPCISLTVSLGVSLSLSVSLWLSLSVAPSDLGHSLPGLCPCAPDQRGQCVLHRCHQPPHRLRHLREPHPCTSRSRSRSRSISLSLYLALVYIYIYITRTDTIHYSIQFKGLSIRNLA